MVEDGSMTASMVAQGGSAPGAPGALQDFSAYDGASAPTPVQTTATVEGGNPRMPESDGMGMRGQPMPPQFDPATWAAFVAGFQGAVHGMYQQHQAMGTPPWAFDGFEQPHAGGSIGPAVEEARAAAAWALWYKQWEASAAVTLPQPEGGTSWQDPSWAAGWMQQQQQPLASSAWLHWQGSYAPGPVSAGDAGAKAPAASAPATDQYESPIDAGSLALGLLRKLQEESLQPEQDAGEEPELATGEPEPEQALGEEPEQDAYAKELASAVSLFLAGYDPEEGDDEGACKPPPESLASPKLGSGFARQGGFAEGGAAAAHGAAVEGQTSPDGGEPAQEAAAAPRPPAAGPTAEGLQDFLSVLRQRKLPVDITTEKLEELKTLVSDCVHSLYRDRLKPLLGIVQRRLRERCAERQWDRSSTEAAAQALLPLCARDPEQYGVAPPMNGEPPVLFLASEPDSFRGWVDVEAAEDEYGQEFWDVLASFLQGSGLAGPISLPNQPHQAAQELQRRALPFLEHLSLGEIEHVVRLSLGRRRLLSHHGDSLKPTRALARVGPRAGQPGQEVATKLQKVGEALKVGGLLQQGEIVDRDDLMVVLLQLLRRFKDGVPLSLLKQHIQTYCQRTLNEAAFNCTKLADVFKLAPLHSIFPLEQIPHRNEIIVKPPISERIPPHVWHRFYYLEGPGNNAAGWAFAPGGAGFHSDTAPSGAPLYAAAPWGAMGAPPALQQPDWGGAPALHNGGW